MLDNGRTVLATYRIVKSRNFDFLFRDLDSRLKHEDVFSAVAKISSGGQRLQLSRWEEPLIVLLMTLSCEDTWKTADGCSDWTFSTIRLSFTLLPSPVET